MIQSIQRRCDRRNYGVFQPVRGEQTPCPTPTPPPERPRRSGGGGEGVANRYPVLIGGFSLTLDAPENTAASVNIGDPVQASASDPDTSTYSLGGADAASFYIVSSTGQLLAKAILGYETKSAYAVTVIVSDVQGGRDIIQVTDVMEPAFFPVPLNDPGGPDGFRTSSRAGNANTSADGCGGVDYSRRL